MNTKRIHTHIRLLLWSISGILCMLLVSCQNNDMPENQKTALHIVGISTQAYARETESLWKQGDKIQLRFSNGTPDLDFTLQQDGSWKSARDVYYEDMAYPPSNYTATFQNNNLCTDQSTAEKYRQSDFLSTDKDITITSPELSLLLKHQSVDIVVRIARTGNVDVTTFNAGTLQIHTKDGKGQVLPLSQGNADKDNTRTWQAHLPSEEVVLPGEGPLFSFFFDKKEYTAGYTLTGESTINPGTRLVVTATFNFKMNGASAEIQPWEDEIQSPDGVSPDAQP